MVKQTIVDVVSGTLTYSGEANLGTPTSARKWTIKKIAVSGGVTTTSYPISDVVDVSFPTAAPVFAWDERASLNYSLIQDTTAPTLSTVTIASDNTNTALAKVGDTVTITIISSEYIKNVSATIAGHAATITEGVDDLHFTATYDMASGDTEGVVPFTIDFEDSAGNSGVQVTAVTGGASVTFDKTSPTAAITYDIAHAVKSGDTLVITATFSEALLDSPVVKIAISGSNTVAATNMTKSSTTVYTYSHTVGAGNGTATVALSVGTDASSNIVTATPTSGATFTVDNTVPTMSSAARNTNTQITVTMSEAMAAASVTNANDGGFVVAETGTPATTYAVSAVAAGASPTLVVLTVATIAASSATGVTVTYATGGNGTATDVAGNVLATDATGVVIPTWA